MDVNFKVITKILPCSKLILIVNIFILLSGCNQKDVHSNFYSNSETKTHSVEVLHRLADSNHQYARPSPQYEISFPLDHGPHKAFRHEWWYLTANLVTENGQDFSSQWTLFRTADNDKHWYFAHAALADEKSQQTGFRSGRQSFQNVVINNLPFQADIDDWSWLSTNDFLPAKLNYGEYINEDAKTKSAFDLEKWQVMLNLQGENNFYLQGQQGLSKKHENIPIASHYYSQPFIDVIGKIYWQGKWQKVTGNAWFDREWGSQMLAPDQQGWDWFSLRLNHDLALMVYSIRSSNKNFVYGSLMHRNGAIETLTGKQIEITTQLPTKNTYPETFKITIMDQQIDINIKILNNKQIIRFGIEYFEGMVTFEGSHQGAGFVEMTGY